MGGVASAIGGVAGAVLPVVGGLIGNAAAAGDRSRADQSFAESVAVINALNPPADLAKEIILQKLQVAGVLNPEMQQAIEQTYSQVANVAPPSEGRDAQTQALTQLQQTGKLGLGPQERAAMASLQQQVAQQQEGARQAALQGFAQRGLSGGGADLLAELQGSQSGANLASQQGLQIGSSAAQNALQAIAQSGQLGGQLQSADTSLSLQKANAADQMNRFNVAQQTNAQQANVSARNLAQQQNLALQQQAMNYNTQQANQELLRQKAAEQQMFQNQLAKAGMQSAADVGASQYYNQKGNQAAAGYQQMGNAVGSLVSGGGLSGLSGLFGSPDTTGATTTKPQSSNDSNDYGSGLS